MSSLARLACMVTPPFLPAALVTRPGFRFDAAHVLLVLCTTFAGAAIGYVTSEPTVAVVTALMAWSTAKPLVIGAAVAGLTAIVNLAKQSYLAPKEGSPAPPSPVPPAPPPPLTIVCLAIAAACFGCDAQTRAAVAGGLEAEAACVDNQVATLHQTDAVQIIIACGPQEGATILAILDGIFASPAKSAALPPAQLASLKASRHAAASQ